MSDVLSQEEIDVLRDAVSEGTLDTLEDGPADRAAVEAYDFVNRNLQLVGRLPGLKAICSQFEGFLGTVMTDTMRRKAKVDMAPFQQVTVDELFAGREKLSCICLVKVMTLKQPLLLILGSTLLVSYIDAICGGDGRPGTMAGKHEMGPIEQGLIRGFAADVVEALVQSWQMVASIRLELQSIEYGSLPLGALPGEEFLEVAVFQIAMEEAQGEMTLAMPHGLIESVKSNLVMDFREAETGEEGKWARTIERSLQQVEIGLAVEVARGRVSAQDIFNLKPGDVISLDPHPDDQLVVAVEGIPKYYGTAGSVRNSQAVRIMARLDHV